jgi:hypothetical protein
MNVSSVETWLARKVARESALSLLGGAGLFLASALVLLMSFWVIYSFLWFVGFQFRHWFAIPHAWRVGAALLVLVLLFIGNGRTDPEYLSEYSLTPGLGGDQAVVFYLPAVGMVSNLNPLSPDQARNGVKMIVDIGFSGPRLAMAALRAVRRADRLRRMDVPHAAEVLAVLLSAPGKISFSELLPQIGKHDPARVFVPLHDVEGIVFLPSPPQGMSLTQDLRAEFLASLRE